MCDDLRLRLSARIPRWETACSCREVCPPQRRFAHIVILISVQPKPASERTGVSRHVSLPRQA